SDGELITRIRVPRTASREHYYRKVGTRRAQAISKVCMAACFERRGQTLTNVRIALGSVGPVTLRCTNVERALDGTQGSAADIKNAQAALARDITPMDDVRSTRAYRVRVAENLVEECFAHALARQAP